MSSRRLAVALAAVVALGVIGFVGLRGARKVTERIVPAVVVRNTDAHRLLAPTLGARVDRLIHGDEPLDRAARPRLIALTFDDGPYPVETPLLLDELADLRVPATFFLIGHDTEHYPALARRMKAEGHEIANHTQTHPAFFDRLSPAQVTSELDVGAATLERFVRDPAIRSMMRPPHGRFTEETVRTAQRDGYHVILWNDDPGDWRSMTPGAIDAHMGANATAPDIVLLHSGRLATVLAIPAIVKRFRAAGFTFVTVGDMLARVPANEIVHPAKLRV